MKETERIEKLFEDLYDGEPWIGVSLFDTLKNITAEKAAKKISPQWNSIWEIVNHIIEWRFIVLQRVHGEVLIAPENNYFIDVPEKSEAAWKNSLKRLEDSQQQWIKFLKTFKKKDFENIYPNNSRSYYEHVHGIIQHDAYHLGQIVLLSKEI
ncbi:MAG: DinB family protein [Ignavibacteria bacterium]|nr:DinB family protein [Ignavibacteria bacterium]